MSRQRHSQLKARLQRPQRPQNPPGKSPPRQEKASSQETPEQEEKGSRRGQDALSNYCVNLNKKAQSGKIDPLMALLDAVALMSRNPESVMSPYEERGLIVF